MKTFNEYLIDNPDFWLSHADYPTAVQLMINDYFYYRYISSEDANKFTRYINRKLNLTSNQFNNLYTKYMGMSFDPLILEELERVIDAITIEGVKEIIGRTNTGTLTNIGTNTNIVDTATSDNNTREHNTTINTTNTGTVVNSGTNTSETDTKISDYPQSTPNGGFGNYISDETLTTGNSTTNNTQTNNLETNETDGGTVTDRGTGSVDTTSTLTMDTTQTANSTDNTNRTNDINSDIDATITELKKGNGSDLFGKYFKLIKTFNPIQWLLDELDECFIQLFDYDNDTEEAQVISDLEAQIQQLMIIVENNTTDITTNTNDINTLDNQMYSLQSTVADVDYEVNTLQSTVSRNTTDIYNINIDVNNNTANIAILEDDVNNNTANIAILEDDVIDIQSDINIIKSDIISLDSRVTALEQGGGGGGGGSTTWYTFPIDTTWRLFKDSNDNYVNTTIPSSLIYTENALYFAFDKDIDLTSYFDAGYTYNPDLRSLFYWHADALYSDLPPILKGLIDKIGKPFFASIGEVGFPIRMFRLLEGKYWEYTYGLGITGQYETPSNIVFNFNTDLYGNVTVSSSITTEAWSLPTYGATLKPSNSKFISIYLEGENEQ